MPFFYKFCEQLVTHSISGFQKLTRQIYSYFMDTLSGNCEEEPQVRQEYLTGLRCRRSLSASLMPKQRGGFILIILFNGPSVLTSTPLGDEMERSGMPGSKELADGFMGR